MKAAPAWPDFILFCRSFRLSNRIQNRPTHPGCAESCETSLSPSTTISTAKPEIRVTRPVAGIDLSLALLPSGMRGILAA